MRLPDEISAGPLLLWEGQMRLYYHPVSSNSRRVLLTAIILGAKLELITVDLLKGEHKFEAYLQINPNGKVPLLDDDGFRLWESHAIMQYLADKEGAEVLYPKAIQGVHLTNSFAHQAA
ncbi:glutathione S-transferase N-terminal domain-containing protein [Paralcaligenes sp. KSB-10]|uniref:glutathione S-transferase family protein n=1 Tax=Paralcaligenes sp. KSB-10 TaxID=2901142 RepID=UPI001E5D93A4|nr:glutathione S-transferase N-terminal domain-containing protein [Paralcaligenes sp. KSB-10]UHL64207.1 glutathione S-transferase N-terminal domain-containing protein [Paralcaligenes sp. KSB-10]